MTFFNRNRNAALARIESRLNVLTASITAAIAAFNKLGGIVAETLQTLSDKVDAQTATLKTVTDNQTQLDSDVNTLMAAYKNGQPWDQALADSIGTKLDANNAQLGVVRDTETTEDAAVVATLPPPPA